MKIAKKRIRKWFEPSLWKKITSIPKIRNRIIKILELKKSGSYDSCYNLNPFILSNGKTLTIRIANHPARETNFGSHNRTDFNVSILIGKNTDTITICNAKVSRIYEEIVYKPHCFEGEERVITIMEILSGLESALTTGKYKKGRHGTYLVRRTN